MADTMPKEDQTGQPEVAEAPLPAWVGPVKVAVMIMSVLIVVGLVLLVYGLSTGLNRKTATTGEMTFQHPTGATLISVAAGQDGVLLLHFRMADGAGQVIMLSADRQRIVGQISLEEAADFGITFR